MDEQYKIAVFGEETCCAVCTVLLSNQAYTQTMTENALFFWARYESTAKELIDSPNGCSRIKIRTL